MVYIRSEAEKHQGLSIEVGNQTMFSDGIQRFNQKQYFDMIWKTFK